MYDHIIQNTFPNKRETGTKMARVELKDFTSANTEVNQATQYE